MQVHCTQYWKNTAWQCKKEVSHAGTISDRTLFADFGIGEDGKFVYLVFCTREEMPEQQDTVLESGITGEGDFTCCPESTESEGTDVCMSQTETAGAAR